MPRHATSSTPVVRPDHRWPDYRRPDYRRPEQARLRDRSASIAADKRSVFPFERMAVTANAAPRLQAWRRFGASRRLVWSTAVTFAMACGGEGFFGGVASAQVVSEVPADPRVSHAYHATPLEAPAHRVIEAPRSPGFWSSGAGQHASRPGQDSHQGHGSISYGPSQALPHGNPHAFSHPGDTFSHRGDVSVLAPNEGLSSGATANRHPGSTMLADVARVPGAATPFSEWAGGVGSRLIPRPPQSSLLQRVPAATATIPEARQTPVWKQPYSYGYFGASGKRHWTRHHSYRDNDTRWILR